MMIKAEERALVLNCDIFRYTLLLYTFLIEKYNQNIDLSEHYLNLKSHLIQEMICLVSLLGCWSLALSPICILALLCM